MLEPARSGLLVEQGLKNNKNIELVNSSDDADYVFFHNEMIDSNILRDLPKDRTVMIDFRDWKEDIEGTFIAYFKRSWRKELHSHLPFTTFAIMDEFLVEEDIPRDIDVGCTLRYGGTYGFKKRKRVLDTLHATDFSPFSAQIGEVNTIRRDSFNREYLRTLKRTKICVSCIPDYFMGDHRTWEALANGCLLFIDNWREWELPYKNPLIDGKHCIMYDVTEDGMKEMVEKIRYYLEHPKKAEAIAKQGHEFAMKHHRASNRIDEIMEVLNGIQKS
tara:strand:- start:926 stop:1750 length:825 start_codon:yes stop_codon:yes gene_type:complete